MKNLSIASVSQKKILEETIGHLKKGGLVVFPSDTVYGLLVDATNGKAVRKLLMFKGRPAGKPISVFTTWEQLSQLVKVDESTRKRLRELLPGPYTIVLPSKHKTSAFLESEDKTLGIRIPDSRLLNKLTTQYKKPITATSANLSGKSPHYSISPLLNSLSEKKKNLIDLIVDAGTLPRNKPSTVVDMTKEKIKILRRGDVGLRKKTTYLSNSENETKGIAKKIIGTVLKQKILKTVTLIIKGELGVGKTIFVKGIGEFVGINNIISPTYVVMYEYNISHKKIKKLIHADLYIITSPEEFKHLGIEKTLEKNNILCIEWGEKAGDILDILRQKSEIIYVDIKYLNQKKRMINVTQ